MAQDVLSEVEYSNVQKFAEKFKKSEPMLFTIGYEGMSLEKYIMRLIKPVWFQNADFHFYKLRRCQVPRYGE